MTPITRCQSDEIELRLRSARFAAQLRQQVDANHASNLRIARDRRRTEALAHQLPADATSHPDLSPSLKRFATEANHVGPS